VFARALPVISAFMSRGVPEGEPVVLDVAQMEALLSTTFGIGLCRLCAGMLSVARPVLGSAEPG
jgi:hypothetical protein